MKKALALILALIMVLAFCACGQSASSPPSSVEQPTASSDSSETAPADSSGSAQDFSGRELVFGVWGGTFADACMKAYVEPFNEMTGANIVIEEYGTDVTVKVIAQKEQGEDGYDVICGCGVLDQMAMMAEKGALMKLDYSQLPNSEYMDDGKYEYCVGQYIISQIIAWNKDVYGDNPPDTMAKYFDIENYPGNRGECYFSPTGHYEMILLANGVAPEDLYPVDVARAQALLDECHYYDSVKVWWDAGATIRQALADGEIDCGVFWGGSVVEGIISDGMTNIGLSHDCASLITDCMAITATCQDPELAHAFVNYCLSAEAEAKWAELKFYAPTNPLAYDLIDPELAQYFTTYGDNAKTAFWCDVDYWTVNFESLADEWLFWVASGNWPNK